MQNCVKICHKYAVCSVLKENKNEAKVKPGAVLSEQWNIVKKYFQKEKEKWSATRINTTKWFHRFFPANLVVFEQNSSLSEV